VILITALMVGAGLAVVVAGLAPYLMASGPPDAVDERMRYYAVPRAAVGADLGESSFRERMVKPLLERIRTAVLSRAPKRYQEQVERDLTLIGHPYGLSSGDFVVSQLTLTVAGTAIGIMVGVLVGSVPVVVCAAAGLGVVCWVGMSVWLQRALTSYQRRIEKALPEVIDFLVVAVDSGLTFDRAMARVVEKFQNPLTEGLSQALGEVQLGRARSEALNAYARRTGVDELHSFIQAILNSQMLGMPLAHTLRVQADEMRWRRRERARQRGAQAPIKMTIPMVVFIFPTIWLVLLGPALFEIFGHGL
jgi:tight adherence protein C